MTLDNSGFAAIQNNDLDPVLLLGPGPSSVSPRVLRALASPPLGYLDADFKKILDEEQALLRNVYGTRNALTFALSGTGMAGMECILSNLLERGERMLVCVNGFFSERMCELAERHAIVVERVDAPWGAPVDPSDVEKAARRVNPKVIAAVHAETSTGCLQALKPLSHIAKDTGALFVADCVTSIGGVPVDLDASGVDAAYAGSQKCLGAPPGLSPISLSEAAMQKIRSRKTPTHVWYFDLQLLEKYYCASPGAYHHTPSNNLHYALLEALRAIHGTEGLEEVYERHRRNHRALVAGLSALGLQLFVKEGLRTPMLHSIVVPEGVDDAALRGTLRNEYRIEIGAGLGRLRGKIFRIGLMGNSSRFNSVVSVLSALGSALQKQQFKCSPGAALEAAGAVYEEKK